VLEVASTLVVFVSSWVLVLVGLEVLHVSPSPGMAVRSVLGSFLERFASQPRWGLGYGLQKGGKRVS
jgi:hypothetical protein